MLVGIRNLDEKEKAQIRASGVHVFTMKDIDRDGIAEVAERALALASDGTGGMHVSFDMDVCDPAIAPGVGTPVKGGLDYREAHMVMELVADSRRLVALDLVEVNPTLDIRNTTAEFATELALSALGKGHPVAQRYQNCWPASCSGCCTGDSFALGRRLRRLLALAGIVDVALCCRGSRTAPAWIVRCAAPPRLAGHARLMPTPFAAMR